MSPRALSVIAFSSGIGPLFGYWCESGRVTAETAVGKLLALQLEHGRLRARRLRAALDAVLDALVARGVMVTLLKGMHTAYQYFPDPGTRPLSDVDLLVGPRDWNQAQAALAALGFTEQRAENAPHQSHWIAADAGQVHSLEYEHADNPWSIDLHRSVDRMPFERLPTTLGPPGAGDLEPWTAFSQPAHVLTEPFLFAYLALHASGHFYTISQLRLIELVLVAQRDFVGRRERWSALGALLARTGTGRFVFPALELAERFVPGTLDPDLRGQVAKGTPRRLRRLVKAINPASAQRLHPLPGLRERFVWIASVREAAAMLCWLLWPPHGGLGAQLRRVGRLLRRVAHARPI